MSIISKVSMEFHFLFVVFHALMLSFSFVVLYFLPQKPWLDQVFYFLLAIVFFMSTKNMDLFIANSAMIFLYGLPLGSNYVERNEKKSKKTLMADTFLAYGAFIIIALVVNLLVLYVSRVYG